MALSDVMLGLETWTDYVSTGDQTRALAKHQAALVSSEQNTQFAIQTGFGSLDRKVETGLDWLAGGIAKLNADFSLLMGEVVWMLQLQDAHLQSILETLQAPLDTAVKELRRRAERAYGNGWYDEALTDFLESANRNYQDFAVHRSIANIYLYHRGELEKSVEYFKKAAKYARSVDTAHAAEGHYYAGVTLAVLKDLSGASQELQAATELNPQFYEAFYMAAGVAAQQQDDAKVSAALRRAIDGDPRYFDRAQHDILFDGAAQRAVQALLHTLSSAALSRANQARTAAREQLGQVTNGQWASSYADLLTRVRARVDQIDGTLLNDPSYADCLEVEQLMTPLPTALFSKLKDLDSLYAEQAGCQGLAIDAEANNEKTVLKYKTWVPAVLQPISYGQNVFIYSLTLITTLVGALLSPPHGFAIGFWSGIGLTVLIRLELSGKRAAAEKITARIRSERLAKSGSEMGAARAAVERVKQNIVVLRNQIEKRLMELQPAKELAPRLGNSAPQAWELEAREHLRRGDKIGAIKVVRDAGKIELREAKNMVESWLAG